MHIPLHAALSSALAIAMAGSAFADAIKVDVVVDFNAPGMRVTHPTSQRPAYYFPLTIGYRTAGDATAYERKAPPPTAEVQHLLAEALYKQGYQVAGTNHPATLVFVIRWGIMAPPWNGNSEPMRQSPRITYSSSAPIGRSAGGGPDFVAMSEDPVILNDPQYSFARHESREMLSLVGGDTFKDRRLDIDSSQNAKVLELVAMARQPRYYFMLTAYGLKDWMDHYNGWRASGGKVKRGDMPTALWEAHVSTEVVSRDFSDVLPTLITTAAPYFGHETRTPQLIDTATVPAGTVEAGTPVLAPSQPASPSVKP